VIGIAENNVFSSQVSFPQKEKSHIIEKEEKKLIVLKINSLFFRLEKNTFGEKLDLKYSGER
jgi:hypothetical protein